MIEEKDIISFKYFLDLFWNNKKIFIFCTLFFVITSIIYAKITKEYFQAISKFVVNVQKTSQIPNLGFLGIASGFGNSPDPANYLDQVIKDESFCQKIIQRKWINGKGDSIYLPDLWKLKFKDSKRDSNFIRKKFIDYFRKKNYLKLVVDTRTGVISLAVEAEDPWLACAINAKVISMLNDYIINSTQSHAKEKRAFIEKRIEEVSQELLNSENDMVKFKEMNMMSNSPKVIVEELRLQRLISKNQEVYLQLVKQYEFAAIDEKNDQSTIEIIRNPEIPIERSKPARKVIVGFSLLIGIFISYLLVYMKEIIKSK
jgi:uncharacterized protein involved in exopolysaccharide biosynthesis